MLEVMTEALIIHKSQLQLSTYNTSEQNTNMTKYVYTKEGAYTNTS